MEPRLRSNLRFSLTDGLAYSLMVGLGESFFSAFVLARGHGEVAASLIATAPLFVGSLIQLSGPKMTTLMGSLRRWMLTVAAVQALSLLILALFSQTSSGYGAIFLVCTLFWTAGLAAGPAWNAWLIQLIPPRVRTGFFASRSRWCHLFIFLGLVAGGVILHETKRHDQVMMGFALAFTLAALARFVSTWALAQHEAPPINTLSEGPLHLKAMNRKFQSSALRPLMIFLLLFQGATHISSSFFTPFMLQQLHLDYATYMALLAAALLSRFVALAFARDWIERWGLRRVFVASVFLIAPMPALWNLTDSVGVLLTLQSLSGIGWGFFELVAFLTLFNELPAKDRSHLLTYFNLLQTSGIVLGAIAGSLLFQALEPVTLKYQMVFGISTACRFLACLALPGMPWELIRLRSWIELRPISVRAHGGLLARPILVRIPFLRRRRQKPLPESRPPR